MHPTLLHPFFNAHHAPLGAFATFTLGEKGPRGGFGLELGRAPGESVFIGLERAEGEGYDALPFFGSSADSARRYDVSSDAPLKPGLARPFADAAIERTFRLGSDSWKAGDLTFTLYSAPKQAPDPKDKATTAAALRAAFVPAVFAELTIDNSACARPRTAFFGYEGSHPFYNTRRLDDVSRGAYCGIGQGNATALVSDSPGVVSAMGFTLDQALRPSHPANRAMGLGGVGVLSALVPARARRTYRFALCFHRDGVVTSGLPTRYLHTRLFPSIEATASYALAHFAEQKALALAADKQLGRSALDGTRAFHLCHAVRAYYGSTQMLELLDGTPFWVVNEGEYRMLNTFDLTVDHLFFELERNPWVVRDQLDWFVRRYSYTDTVRLPGDSRAYPGGLSFTHDMGIGNCISRPGFSSYEQHGLHGCFSHMTHEQLVNWVVCATSYSLHTADRAWTARNLRVFRACLRSLVNRDHPDPKQRDGVMSADSSRCEGGSELTTYDSLDASLGQARNNLYLAVKTWAAYLGLERILGDAGALRAAHLAAKQARLAARTIAASAGTDGTLPAILHEGSQARIIPAIEGVVFPARWGQLTALREDADHGALLSALDTHLRAILRPGVCRFPDGGWKLTSSNNHSWLSKIYLCQHVARTAFATGADPEADLAHQRWLLDPENTVHSWSDQMVAGKAKGSLYYPRGVTSWLWLSER